MPQVRQITTLDELMRVRHLKDLNQVACPNIADYAAPRHARDITALPGEVIWRILQAGLYIHTPRERYQAHTTQD